MTIYGKENIDNYTCIPLKNVTGENNRFPIAIERKRERDVLGLTIFTTRFLLFSVNTEAIANMMPRKNKGDGPIVILTDGC